MRYGRKGETGRFLYLVDTSAWIDYLQERDTEAAGVLGEVLDRGYTFGITSTIYQELLQGAASEEDFGRLDEYLCTQRFYHPGDPLETYREAALLYFRCRRAGITVRSTIDCLIARQAIEQGLLLIHNDRDFSNMADIVPELKLA